MGKTKDRDWLVPDHLPELLRDEEYIPLPVDDQDRAAVGLFDTLRTIGGAATVIPVRVQIAEDRYLTVGFRVRWTLFAPAQHLRQENGHEPEASIVDPEPVEA